MLSKLFPNGYLYVFGGDVCLVNVKVKSGPIIFSRVIVFSLLAGVVSLEVLSLNFGVLSLGVFALNLGVFWFIGAFSLLAFECDFDLCMLDLGLFLGGSGGLSKILGSLSVTFGSRSTDVNSLVLGGDDGDMQLSGLSQSRLPVADGRSGASDKGGAGAGRVSVALCENKLRLFEPELTLDAFEVLSVTDVFTDLFSRFSSW